MSSTHEKPQAQAQGFISVIFKIVAEMLNSAKINDLSKINRELSVDSLFKELASQIKGDPTSTIMIRSKLENYKLRISIAQLDDDEDLDDITLTILARNSSRNGN